MKALSKLLLAGSVTGWAACAGAQTVSLEDLARRVEALERENAALKAQVQRMTMPTGETLPGEPVPVASHSTPAVPPISHRSDAEVELEPWDHAYVGIHGGYTRFHTDNRVDFNSDPRGPQRTSEAPSIGVQLGRRWQSGNVMVGLELEANFPIGAENSYGGFGVTTADLTASGRIKGQIGAAAGPFAAYGIAGFQIARFATYRQPREPLRAKFKDDVGGFIFGAGLGYSLGNGLAVDLEATRSVYGRFFGGRTKVDAIVLRLNQVIP